MVDVEQPTEPRNRAVGRIAPVGLVGLVSIVSLVALLTVLLRLAYLTGPLSSDEGGFTMVARFWSAPGGELYGAQWVDRPPGLVAVFWLADQLGAHGVRLVAAVLGGAVVVLAGAIGALLGGARSSIWATLAASFLMLTPLTQSFMLNGELIASVWTLAAVASIVAAARPQVGRGRLVAGALAGFCASAAVLTKQNFLDATAFVGVLIVMGLLIEPAQRRRWAEIGAATAFGVALAWTIALSWAATHAGVGTLVEAMYGFRADAAVVLRQGPAESLQAMAGRRDDLVGFALGSGIVLLVIALTALTVLTLRRPGPLLTPLRAAGAAAAAIEMIGVVLGGSYWAHYLVGLSPMLILGTAVAVRRPAPTAARSAATVRDRSSPARTVRLVKVTVAAALIVAVGVTPIAASRAADKGTLVHTAQWLRAAAHPEDTLTVLYSHPNIIEASGLRPAYPYAWSLPVRTRDPQLRLLRSTLLGPKPPTWVLGWDPMGAWRLDADGRIQAALAQRYTRFATVCRRPVWLVRGTARTAPADPCARPSVTSVTSPPP